MTAYAHMYLYAKPTSVIKHNKVVNGTTFQTLVSIIQRMIILRAYRYKKKKPK